MTYFKKLKTKYNNEKQSIIIITLVYMFITFFTFICLDLILMVLNLNINVGNQFNESLRACIINFDSIYTHFENNIWYEMKYSDRWLNYIPLIFSSVTVLSIIKTLMTGKCCLLKGLNFYKVWILNLEIALICLIPYYILMLIISIFVIIIINIFITFIKEIAKLTIIIKDKYNNICSEIKIDTKEFQLSNNVNKIENSPFKIEICYNANTYGKTESVSKKLDKDKLQSVIEELYRKGYICVYEGKYGYTFKLPL